MNSNHTPTPWAEIEMPHGCNDEIHADDGSGRTICEFPYGLDENSAFIVRAANAHDDLVAALTACRAVLVILKDMHGGNAPKDAYRLADEVLTALAKAEGGAA